MIARLALCAALALGCAGGQGTAQDVGVVQSDILVVDPERLFDQTRLGKAIADGVRGEREALIALNRRLEAELEAEEQSLTDQRASTQPDDFRKLADAFDLKVQEIRRDSERRVRELEQSRERAPLEFMRRVEPILVEIMREAGGVMVMDRRTILLQADVIDITAVAISRIDAALEEGRIKAPLHIAAPQGPADP